MLFRLVLLLANLVLAIGVGHAREFQAQVYRTFMPDAGPSAFGVILGPEIAVCYDPLRGGVNQAWNGSLDITPTLRAKINEPAKIQGEIFYKEALIQPLRVNAVDNIPERRFKGYDYDGNGVTFAYTLDGVMVRETITATVDGLGLERRWKIPEGTTLYLLMDEQPKAKVALDGATQVSTAVWKFTGSSDATLLMRIQPN